MNQTKHVDVQQIDVNQLGDVELRELVGKLMGEVARLQKDNSALRRMLFGRRSERTKFVVGPGMLPFAEFEELKVDLERATAQAKQVEIATHTRNVNKRRSELPAHLPRERVERTLPEAERACPECGTTRQEIGEDVTQELERLEICFVREIAQKKYACRACQGHVVKAKAPDRVLEKCLLGPAFLAQVAFDRFANHMPYARLERKYAVEGVDLSRSVLCSSMARLAGHLKPVFAVHTDETIDAITTSVLQVDDTEVLQRNGNSPGSRKVHVWAWRNQDGGVVFHVTAERNQDTPRRMLGDRAGLLQGDGHDCYKKLGEGVVLLGCMAHARRKFEAALMGGNTLARQPFEWMNVLFAIEREAKALGISSDEARLLEHRRAKSVPILTALRAWIDDASLRQIDLPQSPLMDAVGYCRNQWVPLTRFAENGRIREISNNACENTLRNVVLGRKNWLFFGNEDGAESSMLLLSLIQSCRELGINPLAYLRDVMSRVHETEPDRMHELTPRGWRSAADHDAKIAAGRRDLAELVARLQFDP